MAIADLDYRPVGTDHFEAVLTTGSGHELRLAGAAKDEAPEPAGASILTRNLSLVTNTWAYSMHEFMFRRSRAVEKRRSHRRAADAHAKLALGIADLVDDLGVEKRDGWCSACLRYSTHVGVDRSYVLPSAYICDACGAPTTPCLAPRCKNMANRSTGRTRLPRYCAEHCHEVYSFDTLDEHLGSLDNFEDWAYYRRRNLRATTKVVLVSGAVAALAVPAALAYAPAIGGALGASVLGGELTGAAASSHGLAMLGLGSVASGGFGMAGGTAVVVVGGAALGGGMGAAATAAYVGDDKSFRVEKLREGQGPVILLASGFLTENDDGWGRWRRMIDERYPDAPVYRIHWGSKELAAFGLMALQSVTKVATVRGLVLGGMKSNRALAAELGFLAPVLVGVELVKNPWHTARNRAEMTGQIVADLIARTPEEEYVLVGHSLGARVMATAAQALGTRSGKPRLTSVHLIGAAISCKGDWRALNDSVHDTVWNYHSANDRVLGSLYRNIELRRQAAGKVGIATKQPRVRNRDVTRIVHGHSGYFDSLHLK